LHDKKHSTRLGLALQHAKGHPALLSHFKKEGGRPCFNRTECWLFGTGHFMARIAIACDSESRARARTTLPSGRAHQPRSVAALSTAGSRRPSREGIERFAVAAALKMRYGENKALFNAHCLQRNDGYGEPRSCFVMQAPPCGF
jgi:hypothetical protein